MPVRIIFPEKGQVALQQFELPEPGHHLLIIGAGPVGQMAIRWAAIAQVDSIAVVDLSPARLEYARRGGATHS